MMHKYHLHKQFTNFPSISKTQIAQLLNLALKIGGVSLRRRMPGPSARILSLTAAGNART